ncbi:glycosyltransferase family 2 protein [soil metagenome]
MNVVAVIPALDEADCIASVVEGIRPFVTKVVVADNGSIDSTASAARSAGADVIVEAARGYGAACARGVLRAEEMGADVVLFLDGDGSDDPSEAPLLIEPITRGEADFVLGRRTNVARSAMTPAQRVGNRLAPLAMRVMTGAPYHDMPPFKAIRMSTLRSLDVRDRGHGYTVELMLKAHARRIRLLEVPVRCLPRRAGESKVSGTLRGTLRASAKILSLVAVHGLRAKWEARP